MARAMLVGPDVQSVRIPAGVVLQGDLSIPRDPLGAVIFAHGSGSSRLSPRNQRVAMDLQAGGFATLLFDLLTPHEEAIDARGGLLRFNVPMLAERLASTTDWLASLPSMHDLKVGYFGASTGAAAALVAAATRANIVRAVVSRGGRPDLAGAFLGRVRAPTLLIVGGDDTPVIEMNRSALRLLASPVKALEIVPGATHLFEEPGTLEHVSELAVNWFERYLAQTRESADQRGNQILSHERSR